MKRSLLFLSIMSLVLLSSCSEDEPQTTDGPKYGGEVSYTAAEMTNTLSVNSIQISYGIMELTSYLGESSAMGTKSVSVTVYSGIAETSYDVKDDAASVIYYMYDGKGNFYYSGETPGGNVEITEIDEVNQTMSGTFSALLKREKGELEVTNGTFTDVPYVIQKNDKATSTMAKLDGVAFKADLHSYGTGGDASVGFAFSGDQRLLDFTLPGSLLEVGTFDVTEFDESSYTGIRYIDGIHSYRAKSGTVTITEYTADEHIKGTFEFEVESYPLGGTTKSFTEGTFDVTF